MIVLGIHDGHCSSACLMIDGRLEALAAEERFTRLKSDHGYPFHAIEFCLQQMGLTAADLDEVAFATKNMHGFGVRLKAIASFDSSDWLRLHREYWKPKLYEGRENTQVFDDLLADERFEKLEHYYDFASIGNTFAALGDHERMRALRLDGVRRHLGIEAEKVRFYDHHTCHAYYALFGSPIRADNTMIYTLDGGGDGAVSTLFRFADGKINELARANTVDMARIYREITLILGMKLGEHEYKVMGLAPYATKRETDKSYAVFDGMFDVRDDLICYAANRKPPDLHFYFLEAFTAHRFDGIAAATQKMVETAVMRWFERTQAKYQSTHAVFAGGVAMNVKLNMLAADADFLNDFYVCPSPTDDTLCVGACYMAELAADGQNWQKLQPITNAYLGPAYGHDDIMSAIAEVDIDGRFRVEQKVTPQRVAELLDTGNVVARCSGRMEFGARALGNRSIIADPRHDATVEKINHQIKYRDFWMPFAPVILAERAADYLVMKNPDIRLPYMMIARETMPKASVDLPAALHRADKTVRPQVISREQNAGYYDIIKAFEARTGSGALLNTSFNLHGEPIVCTPRDAISTFLRSELDVVLMDDVAILRDADA